MKLSRIVKIGLSIIFAFVVGVQSLQIAEVKAQNARSETEAAIADLESELQQQETDVVQELQKQIEYYNRLLSEADAEEDRNKLIGLINETNKLLAEYLAYQASLNNE